MNKEEKAAFINSQSVCAMIEAMGMQAENKQREVLGNSMAYSDEDFFNLINRYGISHNDVVGFMRGEYD